MVKKWDIALSGWLENKKHYPEFLFWEANFIPKSRIESTGKDIFIQQGLDDRHV